MARTLTKTHSGSPTAPSRFEHVLLGLCLCILALRVTYTESPTVQTTALAGGLSDTVYGLTVSGLLIFALVAWLLWRILAGHFCYRFTGIEIGLGLFLLAAVVSTAGASDKRLAITQAMILLGPMMAAILLVQILDTPLKIRLVLIVVGALAIVSTYQSAEQFLVGNQITIEQYEQAPETLLVPLGIQPGSFQHFLFEHRLYSRGIRGFFTTGNSAASFALMASFATLALLAESIRSTGAEKSRPRDVACRAVAAAFVLAGLLLTQSKGGILGFLLAAVAFAGLLYGGKWLAAHGRLVWTVLLPLGLILVVAVGYVTISYGLEHSRLPGGNSMLVRWQYWAASAQMFRDHPLAGVGPGNFADSYTRYKAAAAPESVADPHSLPLSLLTQYGPLGLVGFLAMVFGPIFRTVRLNGPDDGLPAKRPAPSTQKPALMVLGIVCASLLVLRPLLIPMPGGGEAVVVLYEIVVLYVAPVAAFLIGFLLLAATLLDAGPKQVDTEDVIVSTALGCAVFGVFVHNLIDFAIFEPGVWTTFWVVMACLVAIRCQRDNRPPTGRSVSARSKLVAALVALVLLAGYGLGVWKPTVETTSRIQRAQRAAAMGWFDRAHHLLDDAFKADPLSPAPLSLNGRLYLQEYEQSSPKEPGLLEEAARCFRKAIAVSPAGYKDYEKLGFAYTRLAQYEQAYERYSQAIARYPGSGRLRLHRAQVAEQIGQLDAALADYRQAVEIEEAYREQFRQMYPQREKVASRLGDDNYELAKKRIAALSS